MGSPDDDDIKGKPNESATAPDLPSQVSADRGRLLAILIYATRQDLPNSEISSDEQYTRLVIRGLVRVVKELHRIQSPNQLDEGLRIYIAGAVSEDQDLLLKAPKKLIEDVIILLKEIQRIEESAKLSQRDKDYERFIKKPLIAFIAGLELKLRTQETGNSHI